MLIRAVKYVQQPLVAAYCTKNTLVSMVHTEILLKDLANSAKDRRHWNKDAAAVVANNEGRAYIEIDDYHLILDVDYKKIVKIIRQFASHLPSFSVKDQASLVKASFYKSINIVRCFLDDIYRCLQSVVSTLQAAIDGRPTTEDQLFDRLVSLADEFGHHYEWCKRSFFESKLGDVEEGSDFEVNFFEVVLKEFEAVIDPFMADLRESIRVLRCVFDRVTAVTQRYAVIEDCIADIYRHYADIKAMIDDSNSISRGIISMMVRRIDFPLIDHAASLVRLTHGPTTLVHISLSTLHDRLSTRQEKIRVDMSVCRHVIRSTIDSVDMTDIDRFDDIDIDDDSIEHAILRRSIDIDDYFNQIDACFDVESSQVSSKDRVNSSPSAI